MLYLQNVDEIIAILAKYIEARMLWIDTEVADSLTRSPRLSLIQILDNSSDKTGKIVTILDVIEQPEIVDIFIKQIMLNPAIEKVFHHANYVRLKQRMLPVRWKWQIKFLTIFCH